MYKITKIDKGEWEVSDTRIYTANKKIGVCIDIDNMRIYIEDKKDYTGTVYKIEENNNNKQLEIFENDNEI